GQRAGERDDAAGDPRGEREPGAADPRGHHLGPEKDAGPDDAADDRHRGGEEAEAARVGGHGAGKWHGPRDSDSTIGDSSSDTRRAARWRLMDLTPRLTALGDRSQIAVT